MRSKIYWQSLACAALLLPLASLAQTEPEALQTDWLELVKGYRGDKVGAEVVEIEDGATADTQKVTLAIPKKALWDPEDMEEVVVVGRKPEDPEPLDITYEWVDDYDNDNYGLVIRLGKNTRWPIRLYMNSEPGFIR